MHKEHFVIDAVGHTYDFSSDNRKADVPIGVYDGFVAWLHGYGHEPLEKTSGGYMLALHEWTGGWTTQELLETFFVESGIDMIAMHAVNFYNLFKRGANPWEQCLAVKEAAPDRVLLYAAVDPLSDRTAEFEKMAEAAARGVNGFKFYPVSGLLDARNHAISYSFADDAIYSYFEYARSLGVEHIAIHKAVPTGPGPNKHDRPDDVAAAAASFPDMTFEVVHSGWAFLEDCAVQMTLNPNVFANLETTANAIVRMPRRFARAVGTLLAVAPDRVLFGSGAPLTHPQPIIEAIADFKMPADLLDEGLPELTDDLKAKLLGLNMARLHGIDVAAVRSTISNDAWSQARRLNEAERHSPWARKRQRIAG